MRSLSGKETERRRTIQIAYNTEHGIVPRTIHKAVRKTLAITVHKPDGTEETVLSPDQKEERIRILTEEMRKAAQELEFEEAARLRDEIRKLRGETVEESSKRPKPGTIGSRKRSRGRTRK